MNKLKAAEAYTIIPASRMNDEEVFGYQHIKLVEREAFLAGWSARGKADWNEICKEVPNLECDDIRSRSVHEILEAVALLDE